MAVPIFRCGAYVVAEGVDEFDVGGLSLPFTPTSVTVSLRQPQTSSDIINAFVTGEPSSDGFSVVLSAKAPSEGYVLDWTAYYDNASGEVIPDVDASVPDYAYFIGEVARFLGYDQDNLTEAQTAECDSYVQSGVRNFYYPPMMDGVDTTYEWSFLRQTGEVTTAPGVDRYLLGDGFGRIAGQLSYPSRDMAKSVPVIPFGDVERMNMSGRVGRPRFASVISKNTYGDMGQRTELILAPTPDREYDLSFRFDAYTGKLDYQNHRFPLGGFAYSELVLESCLSVAEQRANDERGIHTEAFNRLLVSAISRDRKSGAQTFGPMGDVVETDFDIPHFYHHHR